MVVRQRMLRAAPGPVAGAGAQLLLLVGLARTVGMGPAGWLAGAACGLVLAAALTRGLWHDPLARISAASWVTLTRATLAVGVAALTASSFERDIPVATFVALASVALALDFVDGWMARRTNTMSALGARLDGEVDAFLILALSVEVARSVGVWVLAIGLARYLFLAAGWPFAWMRAPLPRRDWRKVVTAAQGIVLTVAVAAVLPPVATSVLVALALVLLAESFGRDVWWLRRHRSPARPHEREREPRRRAAVALTVLAFVVVWAALVAPTKPWLLTPGAFVRIPIEGIVIVALVVVLPDRVRRVVPWVFGPALGVLVLVKLLDIGFFIAFDRPFNPVDDWSFFSLGVETTRDTFGRTVADLTVAAVVLIVVAALVLPTLAMLRLTRVAVRHRRHTLRAAGVLAGVWLVFWAIGAHVVTGASVASASGAALAVEEVHAVQSDLRDHARFSAALQNDQYRNASGNRLVTALRGKNVLLVFVESYGRLAVEGSPFSPSVDAVLDDGTKQLAAAGFSARSGWLTSSTFGGGSWWAHATLQSGTWINTQGRYDELVKSDRLTLASAFGRAGWRTVADDPSNDRNWPEGTSFYHYDRIYDRRDVGYHGPTYGFSSMPDQYTLLRLQQLELAKASRPLFAEVDLTTSHTPWTRIPPFIPWSRVGDGSIFNRLPVDRAGLTDTQDGYSTSIKYTLRTLFSFIQRYGSKNLALIVLGDHQPSRVAVGYRPGHDVPISIIAHDPTVLNRIGDWGWVSGMRPGPTAPVWPMSAFRNRFLSAYGS
jgi:phosphatidylglycerophosphate synthase